VPLLNRFVKTEDVSTYRARFYRQAGEAKDKLELYNKYLKDGNSEKRRELAPWVILGRRGNMMWKQMNAIRDRELKISRDDTLTTAERDAQLKALADKQIDLSEKYHRLYKRKTEGA
jgi:acyl carrier protein phosphodiesterase